MKRLIVLAALVLGAFTFSSFDAQAQVLDAATLAKREAHKNLTIKEWNTDAKSKTKWLDRVTTYDELGRKVEETEYNQYGQSWRETYEYGTNGRTLKCTHYNAKDKVESIKKYEYNSDGTKKKQYNYAPNGKLLTVKVFEYTTSD